ncbi:MAG: NifB/NifX family molybdenum-iron cluster-binding protein [Lachnospiraceae bacterium]|nr:NifB/NifX family molybdenum-iron cluster-binding protein [Lachnospiraceae bacterium]MDD3617521.1 NifB/NifX family molybdenum-iron cluster-binding protein [Lachnospiraceae bacterium]
MKIAVTYEAGQIFQHFGHCENFKMYEVDGGVIKSSEVVSAVGSGHGALAGFLKGHGVDTLICGGIGGGARNALAEIGITLYPGASGDADANVMALLADNLQYDPNTMCSHHHHEEGHDCGSHSCGEDKHGCGGN